MIPIGRTSFKGSPSIEPAQLVTNSHWRGAKYRHSAVGRFNLYNSSRRGPPYELNRHSNFASVVASI